ncbi:hypothetical protein [Magnetococcus marinus]|uniref:hypothetical protein n=1 Tax=Magnetococcus marinus TaxID=1124597 RepID=UPI0000541E57|nr:hypothetical protein [Magnetococcus marinus]
MDINAGIVDQRVLGIVETYAHLLPASQDELKLKASAFVLLSIATCLDVSIEKAAEMFTDGGQDMGVDGLAVGEIEENEFQITLF